MSLYGVIGYHVPNLVATLLYLSQIYSYYIRGDRSPLRVKNAKKRVHTMRGMTRCDAIRRRAQYQVDTI